MSLDIYPVMEVSTVSISSILEETRIEGEINVSYLFDKSSSMTKQTDSGTRNEICMRALRHFREHFNDICRRKSVLVNESFKHFGKGLPTKHHLGVDDDANFEGLLNYPPEEEEGGTKLFDSIISQIILMKQKHDIKPKTVQYLILVTDGDENESSRDDHGRFDNFFGNNNNYCGLHLGLNIKSSSSVRDKFGFFNFNIKPLDSEDRDMIGGVIEFNENNIDYAIQLYSGEDSSLEEVRKVKNHRKKKKET